jgi:hypothetical protein
MRRLFLLAWLILPAFPVFPQNGPSGASGDNTPYIIPQTIFVGDKGRLVFPFPLGSAFAGIEGAVIQGAGLPRSADLVISRVELERRGAAARLLVDFQAYVPGLIVLPPIEIASHIFTGLEVNISSILSVERQGMVLSGPAEPLAAPGTAVMIYGTILGILLLLLSLALGGFWGKTRLSSLAERIRRRHVIRVMGRSLKRLRNAGTDKPDKNREPLETLSREFRTFLGILTGTNCRAMVPREFLTLPELGTGYGLSPSALSELFRHCDTLRFSGGDVGREAVFNLLEEFRELTGLLDAAEKDRYHRPRSGGGVE